MNISYTSNTPGLSKRICLSSVVRWTFPGAQHSLQLWRWIFPLATLALLRCQYLPHPISLSQLALIPIPTVRYASVTSFSLVPGPTRTVWAIEGESCLLPCDLTSSQPGGRALLVLWYKEGVTSTLYRWVKIYLRRGIVLISIPILFLLLSVLLFLLPLLLYFFVVCVEGRLA